MRYLTASGLDSDHIDNDGDGNLEVAGEGEGAKLLYRAAGRININTAPATDLESLPGIGAKTAERIVEYRQKNGPFKKIEELMNVRGVGEKNFLKLKSQITVAAAKADHSPQ